MLRSSLFVLFLVGCTSIDDNWISSPDRDLRSFSDWSSVAFCEISKSAADQYVFKLKDKAFLEVDIREANTYCKDSIKVEKFFNPYVIRALYINEYTGAYSVKSRQQNLWITHNSLASNGFPIKKSAVIVFLAEKPKNIFVTAYADE